MKLKQFFIVAVAAAIVFTLPVVGQANEGVELKHAEIDVADQEQIRRGLTVFTDVCMGCHSAVYVT